MSCGLQGREMSPAKVRIHPSGWAEGTGEPYLNFSDPFEMHTVERARRCLYKHRPGGDLPVWPGEGQSHPGIYLLLFLICEDRGDKRNSPLVGHPPRENRPPL